LRSNPPFPVPRSLAYLCLAASLVWSFIAFKFHAAGNIELSMLAITASTAFLAIAIAAFLISSAPTTENPQ
jgi:hypothetical protein